ncbi:hypothetical protein ACOMHN_064783 [Nucella lapillus]
MAPPDGFHPIPEENCNVMPLPGSGSLTGQTTRAGIISPGLWELSAPVGERGARGEVLGKVAVYKEV